MSKKKKKKSGGGIFSTIIVVALFVVVAAAVVKVGIPVFRMYYDAKKTVESSTNDTFKASQTSIVYDIDGNELKKLKGEKDVYYLDYDDISDAAKLAIISVEDKNFTKHHGVDVVGMARSIVSLIIHRGQITQGGSTITQQLARNIYLTFEQTYTRKLKEIFIASALENKYTKADILEFYLNNVYFANGHYGIEAASQAYFNKSCKELTISQTAFLCAIPNAPNRFNPYEHPEDTLTRRDRILTKMYEAGYISKDQYDISLQEDITVKPKKETVTNDYAQTYILKCATEAIMQSQGFEIRTQFDGKEDKANYEESYDEMYAACRQSLYTSGYRIYTSIDMTKQEQLQASVANVMKDNGLTGKTDDGVYEVQAAAVCIDNSTGRVTAIVGGREENQEAYGLNRAFQSKRQPGSAIKPLLVFAPAFEKGHTTDETVDDSRLTLEDMKGDSIIHNAGDSESERNSSVYWGNISLRSAVEKSSNVVTYRLYDELGRKACLSYLEEMNFAGLDSKDYKVDSACIGGFTEGTTPVEMAAGYATLANDGTYRTPTCIEKITDSSGNKVVDNSDSQKQKTIYSSDSARMMTNVLESCVTSYSATAHNCGLDIDIPVACKTGTTSSYVDGWLCGYSPYYTTAVWVGRDVYKKVDNLKGNTYPAYIWKDFMDKIHRNITRDTNLELNFGNYDDTIVATTEEESPSPEPEESEEPSEDPYQYDDQNNQDDYNSDNNNDDYNNDDNADEEDDWGGNIEDEGSADDWEDDMGDLPEEVPDAPAEENQY